MNARPALPDGPDRERVLSDAAAALRRGDARMADALLARGDATLDELVHNLLVYQAELDAQARELQQANARLERMVVQFRTLFEALPQPAFVVDVRGSIVRANERAETLFGLDAPSSAAKRALRHFAPDLETRAVLHGALAAAAVERRAQCNSVGLLDRDGHLHRVDIYITRHEAATEEHGELFVALLVDETERIASGERLAATNDALRAQQRDNRTLAAVARSTRSMVVTCDAQRRVVWANEAFERLTGYPFEEIRGRSLTLLHGPGTDPATLAHMRQRLDRDEGFTGVEVLNYTRAGEPYWVMLDVQPIRDDEGFVEGFVSVQVDVTERRQTEARVRAAEAFQRAVLDSMPALVATLQPSGHVHSLNATGAAMMQRPTAELLGTTMIEHLEPSTHEAFRVALAQALQGHEAEARAALLGAGGQSTPVQLRVHPLWLDGTVRHVVIVARDVSTEDALLALRSQKEAAEASNQAKSRFLSQMSHELRTPLNAIIGFTELALSEIDGGALPDLAAHRTRLEHVDRAGWHLLDMVNDVLDLSRVETGNLEVNLLPVPLLDAVRAAVTSQEAAAARAGVGIHIAAMPDDLTGLADRTRLQQVLSNLVSNGIKYNQRGGRVDIEAVAGDGEVALSVRDDGRGMSAEQLARLYRPFDRLGVPSSIEGTGIGLTITRHLVQLMGARIDVQSEPGRGSSFTVTLRAAPQAVA